MLTLCPLDNCANHGIAELPIGRNERTAIAVGGTEGTLVQVQRFPKARFGQMTNI